MLGLLCETPTSISAQSPNALSHPKEVLESYCKMDAEGGRLTADGWYRASEYFVKPERLPQHMTVGVIDGERVDDPDPWFKGGTERVQIQVLSSAIGQIDYLGRFTSVVSSNSMDSFGQRLNEAQQIHGPAPLGRIYHLVLTNIRWEFEPGREELREVKGVPEWRIENFEPEPWVTIKVAIRYLTRLRDESKSERIKRNANESIAALSRSR